MCSCNIFVLSKLGIPVGGRTSVCIMKTKAPFDQFSNMGKRHPDSVELSTIEALLAKARDIGYSEDEVEKLRHRYRLGLNEICK